MITRRSVATAGGVLGIGLVVAIGFVATSGQYVPGGGGGGGGITNGAAVNVVPKSDGTNLVSSAISDNGSIHFTGEDVSQTAGTYTQGGAGGFVASGAAAGAGLNISGAGHVRGTGSAPTLSTCGTSPSIVGSDIAGRVTTGSAATACTITFAVTYSTAPACIIQPEGGATMPTYTTSATAITMSVDIASTVYNYQCVGNS